jgi:predicted nucleotidyltransferase
LEPPLDEIVARYPPINEQRQILNASLRSAVTELRALDAALQMYVDGSYVTRNANPNDVDLLIITARYSERTLIAYLDQVCPVEAVSLDINVEPEFPNRILELFTSTRTGHAKGILHVI